MNRRTVHELSTRGRIAMGALSASQLLYLACGSPTVEGCQQLNDQPCWVCGGPTSTGVHWRKWSGSNFVDQNRIRGHAGEYVCPACVFVTSRTSPVPGRPPKPGKKFGANFRNVSNLLDTDGYVNTTKGEKPVTLEWLRRQHRGPWFASVADSGQKHVVPFCPVNPDGCRRGVIMFDETLVRLPAPDDWLIVDQAAGLLTAGVTKAELESGDYTPRAWSLTPRTIEEFESRWSRLRGGPWFRLVVWLAQRDEEAVKERIAAEKEVKRAKKARGKTGPKRKRKTADADGGSATRSASGVFGERSKRDNALDPARDKDAQFGEASAGPGRVGDTDAKGSADRGGEHGQLSLFG